MTVPFLKWVGGKRQLMTEILSRLPSGPIDHYVEPFLGGGAVFFALAGRIKHAVLSDTNAELIDTYRVVRDDVGGLVEALQAYRYDQDLYYATRAQRPTAPVEIAARMIFLNRCGFNGLYRVNSKGDFNVSFGRYANPTICDAPALHAASRALQCARLRVCDFASVEADLVPGAVAYFDPPYVPLSTTSFTGYARGGFDRLDQRRLRDIALDAKQRGVHVLLSNSTATAVRDLYEDFDIAEVEVTRKVNSKTTGRGPIGEYLIS